MERMGMVIKLKSGKVAAYKRLHADVWPDILAMIQVQYPQLFDLSEGTGKPAFWLLGIHWFRF